MYHEYQQLIHENSGGADGGGDDETPAKRFHHVDNADGWDRLALAAFSSSCVGVATESGRHRMALSSAEQHVADDGDIVDGGADFGNNMTTASDAILVNNGTDDDTTTVTWRRRCDAMAPITEPNPFRLNLNGDGASAATDAAGGIPPDSATCCIELEGLHLARAHWMQLQKLNLQVRIVQRMFVHLLKRHREMRPIWQFGRHSINYRNDDWPQQLIGHPPFKAHCTTVQAAFTMIMDNLDESGTLTRLLRELGTHHFYYDALESHLCRLRDAFMAALCEMSVATDAATAVSSDERLVDGWIELWAQLIVHMSSGITQQRHVYLTQCVTAVEMDVVRKTWQRIRDRGVTDAAQLITSIGVKVFEELLDRYGMIDGAADGESATNGGAAHDDLALKCKRFVRYANELLNTLDRTVQYYSVEAGFAGLAEEMRSFVHWSVLVELCAPLVRRAFMEGLSVLLNTVFHHHYSHDPHHQPHYYPLREREPLNNNNNNSNNNNSNILSDSMMVMDESLMHIWSKMYRVHEQAIIANVVAPADRTPSSAAVGARRRADR